MPLTADQAGAIFAGLPTAVRATASIKAIGDNVALGRYLRAACAIGADRGVHVTAAGAVAAGDKAVDAAQSEHNWLALPEDKDRAKAADAALKALLSKEERSLALVYALYASGWALADSDGALVRADG